jgi:hypothetical protein
MGLSLASVLLLAEAPLATAAGPWRAQIVDAETKQPLEGVVVVALWTKNIRGPGGAGGNYYDSQEVLTDKDGRFTIASRTFFSLNPLVFFRGPEFVFFKPGYGQEVWRGWYTEARQWPEEKRKRLGTYSELLQLDGIVLEMPRLRTLEERKAYIDRIFYIPADILLNWHKAPLLQQAEREERRAVGYRD